VRCRRYGRGRPGHHVRRVHRASATTAGPARSTPETASWSRCTSRRLRRAPDAAPGEVHPHRPKAPVAHRPRFLCPGRAAMSGQRPALPAGAVESLVAAAGRAGGGGAQCNDGGGEGPVTRAWTRSRWPTGASSNCWGRMRPGGRPGSAFPVEVRFGGVPASGGALDTMRGVRLPRSRTRCAY